MKQTLESRLANLEKLLFKKSKNKHKNKQEKKSISENSVEESIVSNSSEKSFNSKRSYKSTNQISLLNQIVLGDTIIKTTPELNRVTYIAINAEETTITHEIVE